MDTRTTSNEPVTEAEDILAGSFVEPYSPEEAREIFDETAMRLLGISGEEFLKRYDRGDYHGQEYEDLNVTSMEMILPLVRRIP